LLHAAYRRKPFSKDPLQAKSTIQGVFTQSDIFRRILHDTMPSDTAQHDTEMLSGLLSGVVPDGKIRNNFIFFRVI
jgi:hypothetical protein